MIDSLCFVGSYPFRRYDPASLTKLAETMASIGFEHLLVAHLSSIFYRNPWIGNIELLSEKLGTQDLKARVDLVAGMNPDYAVVEDHIMSLSKDFKGVLISPIYHGFRISSRTVKNLLELSFNANLAFVVLGYLEDPREMHRAYRFRYKLKPEDFRAFLKHVKEVGHSRVALFSLPFDLIASLYRDIAEASAYVDVSSDTVYGPIYDYVKTLVENISEDLVVFASRAPLTYVRSVLFKVLYSDISESAKKKILCVNATKLFNLV